MLRLPFVYENATIRTYIQGESCRPTVNKQFVSSLVHDHDLHCFVAATRKAIYIGCTSFYRGGLEAKLGSLKAVQVRMFHLLSNIDQKCR